MSALAPTAPSVLPPGRYGIVGVMRSEWTKLVTVRSTKWTLGLFVVLGIGIAALATAETSAHWNSMGLGAQQSFDPTQSSLIGVAFGQLVLGILGALVISAEYGTGTIRATLSAAPRRPLVLVAKVVVFGAVAFAVAEVVSFVAYFLGQALLSAPAPHTTLADPGAFRQVFGAGLYLTLIALLALGLATIIRHTAGAISAFVGVLLVLPLVVSALPNSLRNEIMPCLPANIGNAVTALHPGGNAFAPWDGLALLAGYAAVSLAIGLVLLVRRDA